MSDPKVTLILRSFNEGWALRETLPALRAQDYVNTPQHAHKRSFGEAWALAAVWSRHPAEVTNPTRVLFGWASDARRDLRFCQRARRLRELPGALRIRWEQRVARRAGFKAGWAMHRESEFGHLTART